MPDDVSQRTGVYHLTWLGPEGGPCAELLQRVGAECATRGQRLRVHVEPLDSAVLQAALHSPESPVVAWADRVVVACETRLDYPWQVAQLLERLDSGVPWGVVTGCWHDGSRRTGIGAATHWQLPWYRWWEGWYGWFFPELARPAARCATQFDSVSLPIDLATPAQSDAVLSTVPTPSDLGGEAMQARARQLLVVAACHETLQAWQLSAAAAGWSSLAVDTNRAGVPVVPDCILWDDSCQDRLPGGPARLEQACQQIEELRSRHPGVPIIAGLALGHLFAWRDLQRAGASDLIVKPSFGLPLADYLAAGAAGSNRLSGRDRR